MTFIRKLSVSGLLSFGPGGAFLPLEPLNVLIGPNASGKSNLIEVLGLLRHAPTDLSRPIREGGGIRQWLWRGPGATDLAKIEVEFDTVPASSGHVLHGLEFGAQGDRFTRLFERIDYGDVPDGLAVPRDWYSYVNQLGYTEISDYLGGKPERMYNSGREQGVDDQSILSQIRDPVRYPTLHRLQTDYARIQLYRSWTFGPQAQVRQTADAMLAGDQLADGGINLANVLSGLPPYEVRTHMQAIYGGLRGYRVQTNAGRSELIIEEADGREISASRLSDGTLRYLALLAILLQRNPPPLVAIDEPELGLHPDLIGGLAELLVAASERMQLIITTHSRQLIDALGDRPEAVVVCEQEDGWTHFERLDADHLASWLERYSLGELWSRGQIGANRW